MTAYIVVRVGAHESLKSSERSTRESPQKKESSCMMKRINLLLSIVLIVSASSLGALKYKLELSASLKAQMKQFYKNKHVLVTGG